MNVLYISPHFPAHYSLFAQRLAACGVKVLGVTDRRDEDLPACLRQALAGHYRVNSLENTSQVLEACEFFVRSFGSIDRVESHLESWIELEAEIRERFDVPGLRPAEIPYIKRKSVMKETFSRAGVPTARGSIVGSLDQSLSFLDGHWPAFIKPDIGVGASDTYTIRSENDLRRFFEVRRSYPYFMEEYLDGGIESFDGLTDEKGDIIFYTSHIYSNDVHRIVTRNENLFYYSRRTVPEDLTRFGSATVRSAGIREKFFHIEFFRLADGGLRGLELNVRPPGGLTTHMFNYACNIDVYDRWASVIAGAPVPRDYERKYHVAFVSRKDDREYALSHDEIAARLGEALVHHQQMSPIEWGVMGKMGYLVRSPRLDELKEMIELIQREA